MKRHSSFTRATWTAYTLLVTVLVSGCSRMETEYGKSAEYSGRKSLAGFGVLRQVFVQKGWKDRTVGRLSERLNNMDAVVWTPSVEQAPTQDVTDWFDEWLAQGNKSLVYVLRDYQTEDYYWRIAMQDAEPEQRVEYRRRAARARMELMKNRLARQPLISNAWFTAQPLDPPVAFENIQGEWANADSNFSIPREVDMTLREYDSAKDQIAATVIATTPKIPFFAAEPGVSSIATHFESVLSTDTGETLVARVTSDEWPDSQLIVVAGGSLINNFGLLDKASREIANQLVEQSQVLALNDIPKVGFLYSDESGVNVSSLDPEEAGPSGMEMLTVWPINVITIHAAIFGLILCLRWLPIFGRPGRIPPPSSADFNDHIQAVAQAMSKTNGEQYARVRISEYMVRVRKEQDGPWVIPVAATPPQTSPSLPASPYSETEVTSV